MATFYLRPSSDISLEHSCSTGSSGYALINEATPDDDSKYIYYEFKGSSSSGTTKTATSSFGTTGTIPATYTIKSATLYIRAKRGGDASSDSTINSSVGSSSIGATKLTTSYANYSCNVDVSNLSRSGDTVSATLTATTAIKCYKNDTGNGRITQAYIQVEAEDTSAGIPAYIKINGIWVKKKIYQKVNGTWQLLQAAPSGYSNGDFIKNPDD